MGNKNQAYVCKSLSYKHLREALNNEERVSLRLLKYLGPHLEGLAFNQYYKLSIRRI
jgi:hypothetical protein